MRTCFDRLLRSTDDAADGLELARIGEIAACGVRRVWSCASDVESGALAESRAGRVPGRSGRWRRDRGGAPARGSSRRASRSRDVADAGRPAASSSASRGWLAARAGPVVHARRAMLRALLATPLAGRARRRAASSPTAARSRHCARDARARAALVPRRGSASSPPPARGAIGSALLRPGIDGRCPSRAACPAALLTNSERQPRLLRARTASRSSTPRVRRRGRPRAWMMRRHDAAEALSRPRRDRAPSAPRPSALEPGGEATRSAGSPAA